MALCTSCGDEYADRRAELGYRTCLPCGDAKAKQVKHTVVPMAKSNYVVVRNPEDLKGLNPKKAPEC